MKSTLLQLEIQHITIQLENILQLLPISISSKKHKSYFTQNPASHHSS